jgi:hypothetical protein
MSKDEKQSSSESQELGIQRVDTVGRLITNGDQTKPQAGQQHLTERASKKEKP